jgi:hypothetical protein
MTKRLILSLMFATLTFAVGVAADKILTAPRPADREARLSPAPARLLYPPLPEPVLPVSVAAQTPNVILDYDSERFFPQGSYAVLGKNPKQFREFEGIAFGVRFDGTEESPNSVAVQIYDGELYEEHEAAFGLITDRHIYFKTKPTAGEYVVYKFDGEFLRRGVVSEAPEGKAVIKGTLTKWKGGHKIGEWALKLHAVYDDC